MPDETMTCDYIYFPHECQHFPAVRVWSDVNQRWAYGCHAIALALHDGPAHTILEMTS